MISNTYIDIFSDHVSPPHYTPTRRARPNAKRHLNVVLCHIRVKKVIPEPQQIIKWDSPINVCLEGSGPTNTNIDGESRLVKIARQQH